MSEEIGTATPPVGQGVAIDSELSSHWGKKKILGPFRGEALSHRGRDTLPKVFLLPPRLLSFFYHPHSFESGPLLLRASPCASVYLYRRQKLLLFVPLAPAAFSLAPPERQSFSGNGSNAAHHVSSHWPEGEGVEHGSPSRLRYAVTPSSLPMLPMRQMRPVSTDSSNRLCRHR